MVTPVSDPENAHSALLSGAVDVIEPFDSAEILDRMRPILRVAPTPDASVGGARRESRP